jgi:excisionase family DNA binding protein
MEKIILSPIPLQELGEVMAEKMAEKLSAHFQHTQKPEEQYLTPKQTAEALSVSTVTLRQWERNGVLKPARLGSRVRYLRSQINEALTRVNKYERR